jgi:catechol 2,3-dioxygenase
VSLGNDTHLGPAELTVTNLDRAIDFYGDVVGLRVRSRGDGVAHLGADADVVILREDPAAGEPGRHAGLYHVAILYPSRVELARAGRRIAAAGTPIQGASDHGTHEAIYLPDPDGNGVELAADRPREAWPELRYLGGPAPLDVEDLLAAPGDEPLATRAADGVRVGHVHLHVSDLEAATRFYRDGLGFEVMTDLGTAVFVAAGGYHHHVGYNLWRGKGIPGVPDGIVGLDAWTLGLGSPEQVTAAAERLRAIGAPVTPEDDGSFLARDPDGIAVRVVAA